MKRSYYSNSVENFLDEPLNEILGELTANNQFDLDVAQRNAWIEEVGILKKQLACCKGGNILFEYAIPRIGKRVDNILIFNGVIYVIEFKVGYGNKHQKNAIDQVEDYALDLKNFHGESHERLIIPLLVSTKSTHANNTISKDADGIFKPVLTNKDNVGELIQEINGVIGLEPPINSEVWKNSVYKPTPKIIEAAQALYQGHDVKDISRSDSGAINLSITSNKVNQIIDHAKHNNEKVICFVTGVPGAGKTLAGLNIANMRHNFKEEEHAVFLSGNRPLVKVLREALARNRVENNPGLKKSTAEKEAEAFIQNIHHFRDEGLKDDRPPIEKVVVFDEAQRSWNKKQTSKFMSGKRRIDNFEMSESEFLISVMDRHEKWAVIICLIGGGQEINTGEAGLPEWFRALQQKFSNWKVYVSNQITDNEYLQDQSLESITSGLNYEIDKDLHLAVSVRSFRSEKSKGIDCLGLSCNSLEYVVRINLCFSSYITAPTVI